MLYSDLEYMASQLGHPDICARAVTVLAYDGSIINP